MKKGMPLEGLRWSRDSGSALYDTPQTAVLGRAGGDASERESWVPVSSQANPLAMVCTFNCLSFRNSWFTVVISNSPRADGLICLATSTTLLG